MPRVMPLACPAPGRFPCLTDSNPLSAADVMLLAFLDEQLPEDSLMLVGRRAGQQLAEADVHLVP